MNKNEIGIYLRQFSDYFQNTWMKRNWKASDWCQFRRLNRTNNVSEGNDLYDKKISASW